MESKNINKHKEEYEMKGLNLPVLFVEPTLQNQLLKIHKRHGNGDGLQAAVLPDETHLSLQAGQNIQDGQRRFTE